MTNSLVASELIALLDPVVLAIENPPYRSILLANLGVPDNDDPSTAAAFNAIAELSQQCQALADQEAAPSFESLASVLDLSRQAFSAIAALSDAGSPWAAVSNFGADLAELLVGLWLAKRRPAWRNIAVLLGLIDLRREQDARGEQFDDTGLVRYPYHIDRLRLRRVVDLVRDPVGALKAEYQNPLQTDDDAAALADKLFPRLKLLLASLGIQCQYGVGEAGADVLGEWLGPLSHALVIYVDNVIYGADADAGIVLTIAPASKGDLGLVFAPFGDLTFNRSVRGWSLDAKLAAGIDLITVGRVGVTLDGDASDAGLDTSVTATLPQPSNGSPAHVFGSPKGSRLEIGGAKLSAQARVSGGADSLSLAADVTKSALVISGGDGDGFVSSLLPKDGLRTEFDLGIGWSSDKGLTLRGSAGLETVVPLGKTVAGVTFTNLHVALRAKDEKVESELSADFSAGIGPVQVAVQRMGLEATLSFPDNGGNLGFADLALGFKSPSGTGLSIDAHGVLTGGGFLSFDPGTGVYGGVVQLTLHEKLSLTGYGLIATRMPDGSSGFSLLVFITDEGFEPIPLGFGFTLQSVGGMLGIHRTFDVEALRSGLKTDSLSRLLFPNDPIRNAPAILQGMAVAFPISRGSYLLGLLARITWFTPTLVQMDLALILELGARTRLLALGRVAALLPSRDNDLIRLNLDTMGVLDFDANTFEADAVLVDSRLVHQFPITGSAALRANWSSGSSANFVLAIGGVNPHFAPPSGFPQLTRVAIALCSGRNPRLICDAYFAVTSNTVQFGSHVALYAEAFDFSVSGDLGFDALITLVPPHFLVDFHASVQLKRGSLNLFKVTLDGTLEGPLPLRLAARATFEILWFSFSVHFDFTLAEGRPGQGAPSVRLEDEVRKALAQPANWSTFGGGAHGVTLRSLAGGAGPVLDPLGQFQVRQQVAPLNTQRAINTFGGARVAGAQRFQLAASFEGIPAAPVKDAFAPARYFTLSDDDKLAAPSFENMDAGVVFGDDQVRFDGDPQAIAAASLEYDEYVLNPETEPTEAIVAAAGFRMSQSALQEQAASGAVAVAAVRQVGRARFRNDAQPVATLCSPEWRLARTYGAEAPAMTAHVVGASLTGAPAAAAVAAPTTWSEGQAALKQMRAGERWALVTAHEVSA